MAAAHDTRSHIVWRRGVRRLAGAAAGSSGETLPARAFGGGGGLYFPSGLFNLALARTPATPPPAAGGHGSVGSLCVCTAFRAIALAS
ncbi:hypothetical protein MTO96_031123 [Rhipicephalus appendiculatus]